MRLKNEEDYLDETKIEVANVMIESELLKTIRLSMYNLPKKYSKLYIDHNTRLNYNLLKTYFKYDLREKFIRLFPQFKPEFDYYYEVVSKVVGKILNGLRNKKIGQNILRGHTSNRFGSNREQLNQSYQTEYETPIDRLSKIFLSIIRNSIRLNIYDNDAKTIIREYIEHPDYLNVYYMELYQYTQK